MKRPGAAGPELDDSVFGGSDDATTGGSSFAAVVTARLHSNTNPGLRTHGRDPAGEFWPEPNKRAARRSATRAAISGRGRKL